MATNVYPGSGKIATQQDNVPKKWTVMVFMGADNLEDEEDLSGEAQNDIDEMREVLNKPGTNDAMNVFVQLHGKGFVKREHIGKGKPFEVEEQDERDPTNGVALTQFIRWALKTADHQPDEYSMLVLWGHAYRFGIGRTATRAGIDALDFAELAAVLKQLQDDYKKDHGLAEPPKLDIIGFDACDLATIEMAYQLHPFAEYMLASQIGIPLPGWPYHRILDRIKNPEGSRVMGPAELGTYIVRRFCEAYQAPPEDVEGDEDMRTVSLTLLDLRRAQELDSLTEELARRLAIALDEDPDEQEKVLDLFARSQTIEDKPFVDVADLCLNLMRFCSDPAVALAAKALGDFLISPGPAVADESERGAGKPFVVEHGRNASQTARLHGISLYAPHVSASHDFESASHFYQKFVFAKNTLWSEVVHALALPG